MNTMNVYIRDIISQILFLRSPRQLCILTSYEANLSQTQVFLVWGLTLLHNGLLQPPFAVLMESNLILYITVSGDWNCSLESQLKQTFLWGWGHFLLPVWGRRVFSLPISIVLSGYSLSRVSWCCLKFSTQCILFQIASLAIRYYLLIVY